MPTPLPIDLVTDVLRQLHAELGVFDAGTRAVVGLELTGEREVSIAPVEPRDDGVLDLDDGVAALVLVTDEPVQLPGMPVAAPLRQLVCLQRDGSEIGLFEPEDDQVYVWRSSDGDAQIETLRPRDLAANTARRALGLPSHAQVPPPTTLLARLWLLHLANLALPVFDQDGHVDLGAFDPADVDGPFAAVLDPELAGDAPEGEAPIGGLLHDLAWEDVRQLAAGDQLDLGPHRVEPTLARWLDADAFAQAVDQRLLPVSELLGALETMGGDDARSWAVEQLAARGWGDIVPDDGAAAGA